MNIDTFLFSLPAHVKMELPTVPVFELDNSTDRQSATLITRTNLGDILQSHNATKGWLIPLRPVDMADEIVAERIIDIMATCLVNKISYYDCFHVPDIKANHNMLPCVFVIDPPNDLLAELTAMAAIDFIVLAELSEDLKDADTLAMDVIFVPMHCN